MPNYLCFIRENTQLKQLIVALNFGKGWQTIDVSTRYNVPDLLKVVVTSIESQYKEGYVISLIVS